MARDKGVRGVSNGGHGNRKHLVGVSLTRTDFAAVSAFAEQRNISRSLYVSNAVKAALAREFAESADWVE